jgi:hypothetical protein
MDLPNLLNKFRQKEETARRLLAIEITSAAVKSAVWQVHGSHTEVISTGSIQAWETDDIADLITGIDLSLSEALAGLESEPDEVVFGLPEIWVTKEGITDSKKPILKQICKKLALRPVGFVVTTEAVIQYIRELEGGPPSAILVNVGADNVAVSLVYLGQLQGTQVVGKSETISSDVEEGLARFPRSDNLPSRMILYDSREDLEGAKQALISYDWQARLPFLHFPKIESLPKDFTVRAIAVSGGQEVAQSLGYTAPTKPVVSTETEDFIPEAKEEISDADLQDTSPVDGAIPDMSANFGFKQTSPILNPVPKQTLTPQITTSDSDQTSSPPKRQPFRFPQLKRLPKLHLPRLPNPLSLLSSRRLTINQTGKKPLAVKIGIIGLLIAICLVGALWAYLTFPKATFTLYVAASPLDKAISFTIDPTATGVDVESKRIPAKIETASVTGSKSAASTGTKTIGDRAKGEVVVYNRTTSPRTFSAGTAIKYQNLRFTLDDDVTVASASTKYNDDFSVTTEPSKASVKVTAVEIGDSYNVAANTQFQIASFATDSYVGSNPAAFSGGSSRQVQAVSETDRKQLKDDLMTELKQQVAAKIQQESFGVKVVTTNAQTVLNEAFSAKAGEEAASINLEMGLSENVYTYALSDFNQLAQHLAFSDIPANHLVQSNATEISIDKTTINDDNTITIQGTLSLSLLPKQDEGEIARKIKGRKADEVDAILKGIPGFVRSHILSEPQLPAFLNRLPYQAQNIKVVVKPAD